MSTPVTESSVASAQKSISQFADKIASSPSKKIVDFLQLFDVYEGRIFEIWELDYIFAFNKVGLLAAARDCMPEACKSTDKTVPFKNFAQELKECNKNIEIGTLAASSKFKNKKKEVGCARVMTGILMHSKKHKLSLSECFDKFFGTETGKLIQLTVVPIQKDKFKSGLKDLGLKASDIDEMFDFLDLNFQERINKVLFCQSLKSHEYIDEWDKEEEEEKFEEVKERPASAISAADIELQKEMVYQLGLYISKKEDTSVEKLFQKDVVTLPSGRKGIPLDKFHKFLTSELSAEKMQADTFTSLMKLQGETEAKEAMIDYVELINLCNGYKELSVESILEKLRVFVIETGMDFLKELRHEDFKQLQTLKFEEFEKIVCKKFQTGITKEEALRISTHLLDEPGYMHYGRLVQNLEQYSRSKADVSATDPHLEIYETIRKHLKRSRVTLFKMFGEKELIVPSTKPKMISKIDFKNELSQFQGIQDKKIDGFLKSILTANGREVDFIKFAHKVGYVVPQDDSQALGASTDLGKSALFNLSQAFGSKDQMKLKFLTQFIRVQGQKRISNQNLFIKEDPKMSGKASRVLFTLRLLNTFANTEAAETWQQTDVVELIADDFKIEGTDNINLNAFIEKLDARRQELFQINQIFDQFYNTLNFKHLTDLYDLFKAEDTEGNKLFTEQQFEAVLKAQKVKYDSLHLKHFLAEFKKITNPKVMEFTKISEAFQEWCNLNRKQKRQARRPIKDVLANFFQLLKEALEREKVSFQKFFGGAFVPQYNLGKKLPELPPDDQERIIEEFNTNPNNPKTASVMEIHKKYKIFFNIKDDETETAMRSQAKEDAFKLACSVALKQGINLKQLFKPYEIQSSPGKCSRGQFINILEKKLGLAKEINPEIIEEITSDFQSTVGISFENFSAKVHSYAFVSKEQEDIYRRLYQHSIRRNANLPKLLAQNEKEAGYMSEVAFMDVLTTLKFKFMKTEIVVMLENIEKNRDGNAYNHNTIALLTQLAGGASPTQVTSRDKTIRFMKQLTAEIRNQGTQNALRDHLNKEFQGKKAPDVQRVLKLLSEASAMEEARVKKLVDRYVVNDSKHGQQFRATALKADLDFYLFEEGFQDDQGLKAATQKVEAIPEPHRSILDKIAQHLNTNQISAFGAFNNYDKNNTQHVKAADFPKALKEYVPSTVKPQDLKTLATRYGKKEIKYKEFFADITAMITLLQSAHYSSIEKTGREQDKMEEMEESKFQTPVKLPLIETDKEVLQILSRMADLSVQRRQGIEEDLKHLTEGPKSNNIARVKVQDYFRRTGKFSDAEITKVMSQIESSQSSRVPNGMLDLIYLFTQIYQIKNPPEDVPLLVKKTRGYIERQNIQLKFEHEWMAKREIKECFDLQKIGFSPKQYFMILDLNQVPTDAEGRFNTLAFVNRLDLDQENVATVANIPDQKIEQELQTIGQWIMEDKLDVHKVLAKYSNPAGEMGSQDLMMFMKEDLGFKDIEQRRTNEYIRYVSRDSRATSVNASSFLAALKRLNPHFADYVDRGVSQSGKMTGGGIAQPGSSKMGSGYGITIQPADDGGAVMGAGGAIVPPSRQSIEEIYARLVAFLQERDIPFGDFTERRTFGQVRFADLRQWLDRIRFSYSQDELQAIAVQMEVDGSYTLRNLSVTRMKEKINELSYSYFRPRQLTTAPDAKIVMEKWNKQARDVMAKFSNHLRSRRIEPKVAIKKMNDKIAGSQEYVDGLIDQDIFVRGIISLDFLACEESEKLNLFKAMDVLKNCVISDQVFALFCEASGDGGMEQPKNIDFEQDAREELINMFNLMTSNTGNRMNQEQLERALVALQEYRTQREIGDIIKTYGSSESLSAEEFLKVMEPIMKRKLEEEEQSFARMRAFFAAADSDHNNLLTEQEFVKVLKDQFKIDLTPAQIHELVSEIDVNQDGAIDIDEFIGFMEVGMDQMLSEKSRNAMLFIRQACQFKPSAFVRDFMDTPQNFRESFFYEAYKRHENFPASAFDPKIDRTTLTYEDLLLNKALREEGMNIKVAGTKRVDKIFKGTKLRPLETIAGAQITLSSGRYVPIFKSPDERKKILKNVVRIGIMNNRNEFLANTTFVPATWSPTNPYTWKFPSSTILNQVLFRTIEPRYDDLHLVFEFVIYYTKANNTVEMGCGWCSVPVTKLNTNQKHRLDIKGGSPFGTTQINKHDTRVMRWYNRRSISRLYLYVKTFRSLPTDVKMHMNYLPKTCLLNTKLLVFASGFRHYLAENLLFQDSLHNLRQGNPVIEIFMKIMNNPDIVEFFTKQWQAVVIGKMSPADQRPGDLLVNKVEDTILKLYPVIYKNDFNYTEAIPTQSALVLPNGIAIYTRRDVLITSAMRHQYQIVGRQRGKDKGVDLAEETGYKPFTINQLIYDPFHGQGMKRLIKGQLETEKEVKIRSRGASPDLNDRRDQNDPDLPNVPDTIVDDVFNNFTKQLNEAQQNPA